MAYDISQDPDLNSYDTDDLQDITKAGLGEGGVELAQNAGFLVFLGIILAVIGILVALKTGVIKLGK